MTAAPTAAIYVRVSSRQQETDGTSLDTQLASCQRFIAERGLATGEAHLYREIHTGTELWERRELARLREAIRRREVGMVVAHAIDRLSRDPVHLGVILSEADHAGVEVHFVTESIDNTPEGQLIRFVRGYAGKVEHEKFRERAARGKRARVDNGKPLAGPRPLYGHRWADADKSRLVPDDATAPVVWRIYAECIAGRSLRTIGRGLMADNIPSPMGKAFWNPTTLRNILTHPGYTGQAVAWQYRYTKTSGGWLRTVRDDDERVMLPEGTIQPLVGDDDYRAAQAILDGNKARIGGRPPRDPEAALLRGMARCGYCGRKLRVWWAKMGGEEPVASYRCNAGGRYGCPVYAMNCAVLDRQVWGALMHRLTHPETLGAELRHLAEEDPTAHDLAPVERGLTAAAREQSNYLDSLGDTDNPAVRAMIMGKLGELEERKAGLQIERERLLARRSEWQQARERLGEIEDWCREAAGTIAGASFARRRELLQLIDAHISLYRQDHEPRWVLEAWLPVYASGQAEPTWRRETMSASDGLPNGNSVQMKVCIFQGWEDDNNPEIIATFYTDRDGNVHVDNEAFYDTVRGIVGRGGVRMDGHDGIAFLHAVRAYFPGPHIWAGEVVPHNPSDE